MSRFIRVAAPPPLPPPPMGGLPPLPPMPGLPGMPPPPGAPAPSSNQKAIKEPLSNLGLILADAEIEKMLMEEMQFNDEGGVEDGHVGKRKEGVEITDGEINDTKETRWERLPLGQDLLDLEIELEDMANAVKYLSFGFSKNKSKEQGGGAPGGMPMASLKLENMVKLARNLDFYGLYSVADRIL